MAQKKKNSQGIVLIKKANNLIESRYKFDIWETRFFLSVLGQIRREDEELEVYRVWYKDIIKNFALRSGDSYGFLRSAAKSLMGKSFFVSYEDNGVMREKQYHILREIDYLQEGQAGRAAENQEYIDVSVESKMKPFLLQLQKNFTAYDMRNIVKLGVYPIRVYELLKQYESIGSRRLEVEEIKKMFEVAEQYKLFGDFYRWVVQPSVKEINEHTDLNIYKVDKIMEGRRVVALHFYFRKKKEPEFLENRGEKTATAVRQPSPGGFQEAKKAQVAEKPVEMQPVFAEYFEKLNDWWGLEKEELLKRLAGKTAADVDAAIVFTKSRIKANKAENPAGVFLDALKKGHKTPEQHKTEKKTEREKQENEKREKLTPLILAHQNLLDTYSQAINDAIRAIVQTNPACTEQAIEKIKATYRAFGDTQVQQKNIEDFRKEPMLRSLVKAEIMKIEPELFEKINQKHNAAVEKSKAAILEIEPESRFE